MDQELLDQSITDLQQQVSRNQNSAQRVQNVKNVGVGATSPKPTRAGFAVTPVTSLGATVSAGQLGTTLVTVTWIEPNDISQVSRYNVYTVGAFPAQTQPTLVASSRNSPAVFSLTNSGSATVKIFVQTLQINGQAIPLELCPATSIVTKALAPIYANNAAAVTGGLIVGSLYRLGGDPDHLCIVH
jgi:hypothetical protein